MTILEAIVQGIIQGATEFLPVSSSGHLSISQHIFGVETPGLFFDIMLHVGTLVAVVFVYRSIFIRLIIEFFKTIKDVFIGRFKWSDMSHDRRMLLMLIIGLIPLFLMFAPVPGTDMKVKDISEGLATDTTIFAEGMALVSTSILLFLGISASKRSQANHFRSGNRKSFLSPFDAILIGITQFFAGVFPGLSRSGSTISVGLLRGIDKQTAFDYSFVLATPAIAAAALVSTLDISENTTNINMLPVFVGAIVSAIVGFIAIKILKWMVSSDKLSIFAFYTLFLGIATIIISLIESYNGVNIFTGTPL